MPFPVHTFLKKVNGIDAIIGNDSNAGLNTGFAFPIANKYTSDGNGEITHMNVYFVSIGPGISYTLGVYDDVSMKPQNLLGETELITTTSLLNEAWVKHPVISKIPITTGQNIWLATSFSGSHSTRYLSETNAMSRYIVSFDGALPDPFIETDKSPQRVALYANAIYTSF